MSDATFKIFRGDRDSGASWLNTRFQLRLEWLCSTRCITFKRIRLPDLAVRWNCKAGKCGSCSAEVNGRPRLTCKTRLDALPLDESDNGPADARRFR